MEFIIELILELVFEGGIEASKNEKIPKYIRYPLIFLISLFFITVICLMYFVSFISIKENILFALVLFIISTIMLVMSIFKFRKVYLIIKK